MRCRWRSTTVPSRFLPFCCGLLVLVQGTQPPAPRAETTPVPVEPVVVRLVAVGDILMHQDVKLSAQQNPAGLVSLWAPVLPLLAQADLAFANLETPVAPSSGRPGRPFQFNAPDLLPAALKASGFTVLATANNHAYDQGSRGLVETLNRLQAENLVAVGSGATRDQAEATRFVTVKGLRLAILGFTDIFNVDLNGNPGQPWVRRLELPAAVAAVRAARAQADAVVVSLHWGVEYQHQPHPRQRQVAAALAEAGADLILGHHPHVLQPMAVLTTGDRRTLVAYSMGNFVSNQDRIYRPEQMPVAAGDSRDGVAVQCRLVKVHRADGSDRVELQDPRCEPLWTENNWRQHRAGKAQRREIQVVPVNAAIRATLAELQQLRAEPESPVSLARILDRQVRLRTLLLRRSRVAEILGPSFVDQGG